MTASGWSPADRVSRDQQALRTLDSIGDAVMCCDVRGHVSYLNGVAAGLVGWTLAEENGRPVSEVLTLIDTQTLARQMSFLAQHDSLTDLPNRASLQERLVRCLAAASGQQDRSVALLFVDLDGFKTVNDTHGHAIGDLLLQSVARRLLTCVRITDTVSRQGGDEFVILLPALRRAHDATAVAEKILRALQAPHQVRGHIVRITASIGIALYPHHGADAPSSMNSADLAMYQVKTGGRNSYRYSGLGNERMYG